METEKFKLKDIAYGLVVPILVGLLIVAFPAILRPALDSWFPVADMWTGAAGSDWAFLTVIFTHGFAQMVMFSIPILLGLLWNKWAGGAAGFIMGTLYYLGMAGYNTIYSAQISIQGYQMLGPEYVTSMGMSANDLLPNLYADPSFIGNYIVVGILLGYVAGALNNGSYNFKRMLGAGLTISIICGILQFVFNYTISYGAWMTQGAPYDALFKTMLPMILLGIIAPVIAKVMTWYGLSPRKV
jgi:hypothetical protein